MTNSDLINHQNSSTVSNRQIQMDESNVLNGALSRLRRHSLADASMLPTRELGSSDPDEVIRTNSSMKSCKHIDHTPSQHPYVPLHKRISQRIAGKSPFFSLEFFPPKTTNSLARFFSQIDRLRNGNPLFVDITWHVSSDPANLEKETSSMSVAAGCLDFCRVETMLHVTCANYTKEESLHHLEQCKAIGIRNILALRGDHPADELHLRTHQFRALDMIRWIKEEYGDYFTLACSGYPTGHPEAPSYKADLQYLKSKVDAGAHFIITQMFFEAEVFENFVRDCREIGITVPIIPGIMPIHSYESIRRIAEVARLTIPNWILDELEAIKHDDEAVRKYGKQKAVDICRRLLKNGLAPSIHLYTLNREVSSREILEELGLWLQSPVRVWPWKSFEGNHALRHREDVRPIFWSIRPKAYVSRTRDWDDFPNGRWGNSSCPAFNDCSDYYLFYMKGRATKEEQLQMYGSNLDTLEAVQEVFINFITQKPNKDGYKVTRLPWNEYELGTQPETSLIFDKLIWCNSNGILTINSQPNVNGEPSTDPVVGWGKPGGYCYQKAYLEFFTSVRNAETIQKLLPACPRLSCHIINHDASIDWTNAESETPIAVTWGVFPGCEVAQPTVVDPISFRVWKDEAFGLWKSWANIYGDGSNGRQLLDKIHDEYCLITMVDNDYPKPSIIFDFLSEVLAANGVSN